MKRDAALQAYFAEAASWDVDRVAASERSVRTAWRVAVGACVLAMAAIFALVLLMPLKRVDPFVIRVDNATEQFLEIRLPEGAALWTARVAGEPVKPTRLPDATDLRRVRIPLLKTAPGDLYYDADGQGGVAAVQVALIGSSKTHPLVDWSDVQVIA